ncbi:hypothetical protein FOT62_21550 [Serratia marcescens]|uniref:Uncharacterized protein n=1 Tax=Serratia marcescens TaxID=615 RepID=A0A5C7BVP4_SERMA|nr:hypothetical protein [Serratia marcescens]TXE28353.1 hypothetical protein FOT62_21550 [Serratia marcescens]TXE56839.1 hypothetical protein FOT56_23505 [Serratia marcescens]
MTKSKNLLAQLYIFPAILAGICSAFYTIIYFTVDMLDDSSPTFAKPQISIEKYLLLLLTIAIFYSIRMVNKKSVKANNSTFQRFFCENFRPNPSYEAIGYLNGNYIGVDTTHGTLLMASAHKNIFKGKNIKELAGYECRGEILTLKFNDVDFPVFRMSFGKESACMAFGHKLDVLLSPSYQPAVNVGSAFNDYVRQKAMA